MKSKFISPTSRQTALYNLASSYFDEGRYEQAFPYLEELNFSFNIVSEEEGLLYCATQLPKMRLIDITGNPFAITGSRDECYASLKQVMEARGAIIVNETLER